MSVAYFLTNLDTLCCLTPSWHVAILNHCAVTEIQALLRIAYGLFIDIVQESSCYRLPAAVSNDRSAG